MKDALVIWRQGGRTGDCRLASLHGWADDWKLLYGEKALDAFPPSARFDMDPDLPDNVATPDCLDNIDNFIVASTRLVSLLGACNALDCVELIPVKVRNHKRRPVADAYTIVHLTNPVDCLDIPACKGRWDPITKDNLASVKRLVLHEDRVPPQRTLFRPKALPDVILCRRELAEAVEAACITGVRFMACADYPPV